MRYVVLLDCNIPFGYRIIQFVRLFSQPISMLRRQQKMARAPQNGDIALQNPPLRPMPVSEAQKCLH